MTSSRLRLTALCLTPLLLLAATTRPQPAGQPDVESTPPEEKQAADNAIQVQYLEIVTPKVDETCEALAKAHNVTFGNPIMEFGNARTAKLSNGGLIGVRGPLRPTEQPVVRPYVLVQDIKAAVKAAEAAGATVAMPPMALPGGHGTFSIYILGGIEHGLWQLPAEAADEAPDASR